MIVKRYTADLAYGELTLPIYDDATIVKARVDDDGGDPAPGTFTVWASYDETVPRPVDEDGALITPRREFYLIPTGIPFTGTLHETFVDDAGDFHLVEPAPVPAPAA